MLKKVLSTCLVVQRAQSAFLGELVHWPLFRERAFVASRGLKQPRLLTMPCVLLCLLPSPRRPHGDRMQVGRDLDHEPAEMLNVVT